MTNFLKWQQWAAAQEEEGDEADGGAPPTPPFAEALAKHYAEICAEDGWDDVMRSEKERRKLIEPLPSAAEGLLEEDEQPPAAEPNTVEALAKEFDDVMDSKDTLETLRNFSYNPDIMRSLASMGVSSEVVKNAIRQAQSPPCQRSGQNDGSFAIGEAVVASDGGATTREKQPQPQPQLQKLQPQRQPRKLPTTAAASTSTAPTGPSSAARQVAGGSGPQRISVPSAVVVEQKHPIPKRGFDYSKWDSIDISDDDDEDLGGGDDSDEAAGKATEVELAEARALQARFAEAKEKEMAARQRDVVLVNRAAKPAATKSATSAEEEEEEREKRKVDALVKGFSEFGRIGKRRQELMEKYRQWVE